MSANKIRKVKLSARGLSGIEVHYKSPVRRQGLEVIRTNQSTDPIPVPSEVRIEMQRLQYYFMLLFSMMDQEDEIFLNETADKIIHGIENDESGRYVRLMAVSQGVYVIGFDIDEDNAFTITADIEMVDNKWKGYTTVKLNVTDEFPRYYEALQVIRDISEIVSNYIFSTDTYDGLKEVRELLLEIMPARKDEILEMTEQEQISEYRTYLEKHGHIVISEDDVQSEIESAGESGTIKGVPTIPDAKGIEEVEEVIVDEVVNVESASENLKVPEENFG